MAGILQHPRTTPPLPAVAQILSQFDRTKLEGFITVAIGLLDVLDGDSEAEPSFSEDDAVPAYCRVDYRGHGAGCEISDAPVEEDGSQR
jgi:hypothetical protein